MRKLDVCASCTGFVPMHAALCPHCGKARKRKAISQKTRLGAFGGVVGGGVIAFTLMACYGAPCANDDVCGSNYDGGGEGDDSGHTDANLADVKVGPKVDSGSDDANDAHDDASIGDASDGGG